MDNRCGQVDVVCTDLTKAFDCYIMRFLWFKFDSVRLSDNTQAFQVFLLKYSISLCSNQKSLIKILSFSNQSAQDFNSRLSFSSILLKNNVDVIFLLIDLKLFVYINNVNDCLRLHAVQAQPSIFPEQRLRNSATESQSRQSLVFSQWQTVNLIYLKVIYVRNFFIFQ